MRIAVVDCGSNTFNLLVADANAAGWTTVFKNKLPVKLGAGGYDSHQILESRFIRGLDALLSYRHTMDNYGVQKVYAFATSALRDATNGTDFIQKADQLFAIPIHLIDGNREAELIFGGVQQAVALDSHNSLIMDIGGGSTEFIIGNKDGIVWKKSYQLGVSRLHDQIQPGDRMNHDSTSHLRKILVDSLGELKEALAQYPCKRLIGSSGSFDTLLDLFRHAAREVDISRKPDLSNEIPLTAFPAIHAWLMGSTYQQRMSHAAIPAIRAELMPLSSYLVKYVLELHSFDKLMHSAYALKEGAMQELWNKEEWPALEIESEKPEDFLEE